MILLAAILGAGVGMSLGLLGGGGSLLMLPILVHVLGIPAHDAVAMSLLIVGVTSGAALIPHFRRGNVAWRTGLTFGGAGVLGAFAGGRVGSLLPSVWLLGASTILMLATAAAMFRAPHSLQPYRERRGLGRASVLLLGALIGFVAGFMGAGGGFLIVPVLGARVGLPMERAIGTSLLAIALQSLAGFAGHSAGLAVNLALVLVVTLAASAGSLVGARLSPRLSKERLRRVFAWLVLGAALLTLSQQLPFEWREAVAALGPVLRPLGGGILVGLAAAVFWVSSGRVLGVSGIASGLLGAPPGQRGWRVWFIGGLLAGGVVTGWLVPEAFEASVAPAWRLLVAGLLVGLGTSLANGCTSGHGVCGVSRLAPRSLVATASFIGAGMTTVYLLEHAFGGLS